jgi:filamentous hemagglutinin
MSKPSQKHLLDLPKPVTTPKMLGQNGVRTPSTTVWKGKGKQRIDVENPNPGQRPGQVHYQGNDGSKYLYDPATNSFPNAPRSVNDLLSDQRFADAIRKAMKQYLGE